MYTCSSRLIRLFQQLIIIFISSLMIISETKIICPLIETLSFGSDIHFQCNESYLKFNEVNNEGLNWKFEDETDRCDQSGPLTTVINQCKLTRINGNYLKVPLKSLDNKERACVYCRINYRSMVPVISADQSDEGDRTVYVFNITATALKSNESFEILWAKRVHASILHSYNYWFTQGCVDDRVKILLHTSQSIIFAVDDILISRVEFIIRRCNGSCRRYNQCLKQTFLKEIEMNNFQIPDAIEKLSCDENCLNGELPSVRPAMTHRPRTKTTTHPTTIPTPFLSKDKLKILIIGISISFTIILIFVFILLCLVNKLKKREPVYAKTNNQDPDEHK